MINHVIRARLEATPDLELCALDVEDEPVHGGRGPGHGQQQRVQRHALQLQRARRRLQTHTVTITLNIVC